LIHFVRFAYYWGRKNTVNPAEYPLITVKVRTKTTEPGKSVLSDCGRKKARWQRAEKPVSNPAKRTHFHAYLNPTHTPRGAPIPRNCSLVIPPGSNVWFGPLKKFSPRIAKFA
jgi:hypothetical protein